MLEERINGLNKISGINTKFNSEKNIHNNQINQSPYIAQLRNFQQRFKSKSIKVKHQNCNLKKIVKDQNKNQEINQQQILGYAKQFITKNYTQMPFFQIDKENIFDSQIDSQKVAQSDLLLKIRDKIYDSKKGKNKHQAKILSSYTLQSISCSNNYGSRLSSNTTLQRGFKVRKFANEISFLKYKKNKNEYSVKYQ